MDSAALDSACREKQLLVCGARVNVEPAFAARIRELARAGVDWEYFIAQAQEHSIAPLLERNLRSCAAEIPAAVAARLASIARENALRSVAQTAELLRVVSLLESEGIGTLPYKGPVIAAQAYGDIAVRQFEDLDIILPQRHLRAADAAVRSLGYEPRFAFVHSSKRDSIPGEYNYFNATRKITLELHTEATLRHFPVAPQLAEYFARAYTVYLGGRSVRTFCAEDALPVYCFHGTMDFWARLVWIADVAELLRSQAHLDWDPLWRVTETLRAGRMVHLGLALAAGILKAPIPREVEARVRADTRATALALEIGKRLLSRQAREQTAWERFRYRRATVAGIGAGWRYAVRLTLSPAEEDWKQTQLPPALAPLHAVVRPLRLLRKYGSFRRPRQNGGVKP